MEWALLAGGRFRIVDLRPVIELPLSSLALHEVRKVSDEEALEIEGTGRQGQWYIDWRMLIEHLQHAQEEKRELEAARAALGKIAKLNHRLQDIFEDAGWMHGETLGLLCDYVLTADPWHPERNEGKKDGSKDGR